MASPGAWEEAEIAVVGAGPAGCSVAAHLSELGHDVLLVDQNSFPREKPCGDGLLHAAVGAARRLGLDDLLDSSVEIESMRVMIGHRRPMKIPLAHGPNRPMARCVPRKEFDAALLDAASARGARFVQARVESFEPGERTQVLRARSEAGELAVRAGTVIAADGATSRIRRVTKAQSESPSAYAIRQYFRTELPLDPVFHIDVPIEIDGRIVPGYGWVFPIDSHTANVGVGTNREAHRRVPSLRALLDIYVAELSSKAKRRFGDFEPLGEPMGSPVGIRARTEIADSPGLTLVGDAAGTTNPITGEGIAFALRGGEELASAVHTRSKRPPRSAADSASHGRIWRSFPQIGIDTAAIVRNSMLKANKTPSAAESVPGSVPEPFLSAVWRIAPESAYETGVADTPAWSALDRCDPVLSAGLEEANGLLLERLSDPMPFVTEVIHDSIRAHLGPMYAAVVLAIAGSSTGIPVAAYEATTSAEAGGVLPKLLTMLVDRAGSKQLKLNNAWAVLTGDFAATRALSAAAKLGPAAVTALSRACQGGCEGGMRDAGSRFAADRKAGSWLEAAEETEGAAMVLATEFGVLARGEEMSAAAGLRRFGMELGVALRIAEEVVDLTVGDPLHPGEAGVGLSRGIYPLPVLYAIEAEPTLPRLLAQHSAEQQGRDEIVGTVRECGALERAIAECRERSEAAVSVAAEWDGNGGGEALRTLATLPAEYVASRVSADALGAY